MSDYRSVSKWINSPQQDLLLDIFFKDSPIKIDWELSGSQRVIDNQLVLGSWAGPHQCLKVLIHEMGHLAEIDDARILSHGWGLVMPSTYLPGRYGRLVDVPLTIQGSLRECRAIAMQWHIQNMIGIHESPGDAISSLKFMPDFLNVNFEYFSDDYSKREMERLLYLENKMLEYAREKYTLEYFMSEWTRKSNLLRAAL